MTDETALLAGIWSSPNDDLPRLTYADWLDEHNLPDRAEFIRLSCELAGTDRTSLDMRTRAGRRYKAVLKRSAELLMLVAPGPGRGCRAYYDGRGFIHRVAGPIEILLDTLPGLVVTEPLLSVVDVEDRMPYPSGRPPSPMLEPFVTSWFSEDSINEVGSLGGMRSTVLPFLVYSWLRGGQYHTDGHRAYNAVRDAVRDLNNAMLLATRQSLGRRGVPVPPWLNAIDAIPEEECNGR